MLALSPGTWCHITPSDSGTLPNIRLLNILTIAPYGPVISNGSILVVMSPPSGGFDMQTPASPRM